ncbi:IS982 family transposase, partial [Thalassotalea sp. G20_0]|uniref:IS982 family transposase n=1 Tax=Thalassotalea sp. G20_0 TaxID=2821093 RepID=UPI001ADD4A96
TPIVVCDNHRIKSHKVFSEEAKRGKTSTGWKFGFKLHLVINHLGDILSLCLTPANTGDRKPVPGLVGELAGWLYGDKGYISEKLVAWLKEKGLKVVTKVRKNMKPKALKAFNKAMLRKRAVIESVNDQLKNISQIEHTRHRSPFNFAVNLTAGLIAYTRQPKKPHIDITVLTEGVPMAL